MKLYTYFRSSAAYRVRIALNIKGIDYASIPVHLLQGGGQQLLPAYRAVNPSALVPALDDDGAILTQSLAILEYLDETRPGVPLLPVDALGRARVRALALAIACDAHPLTNLRVLTYLKNTLGLSDEIKQQWYRHWMAEGLAAVEALLAQSDPGAVGLFCHGDGPTLADCCLVPQVFNAQRFAIDLTPYPRIARIHAHCASLPAFAAAHPAQQPDAE
ncbi:MULTISPECIES: maleylacetoacetate isomerase [unclassified Janthinobacterium]|jgi:maleylacetoacetate isomerase|uniref:Maleylacetoacetate isomerase n=1 Tax=Janthinobacterium lividum TaxID=29581 RepID=A0A1E8PMG1_9BURK|nr:maleylacetoacetate isomerase [Janthinobacterium sp. CG_23.4]MDH6158836.1 maleylacetoacetate isomerase/maleylpyruvate isomerase [Janthinobacterium sp. CG_23.4]OFJ47498.1 maleylacetoacetate isomerase [Janthinobacterium lividum]